MRARTTTLLSPDMGETVFRIRSESAWRKAQVEGLFAGASAAVAEGYVHLSSAAQQRDTVAKHYSGQNDSAWNVIDAGRPGRAFKWERSRGGRLLPRRYGNLPIAAVSWGKPLAVDCKRELAIPDPASGEMP